MPAFRLSKAAKADMLGIGRYTRQRWGRDQMRRYVGGIDARFNDGVNPRERVWCGGSKHGSVAECGVRAKGASVRADVLGSSP